MEEIQDAPRERRDDAVERLTLDYLGNVSNYMAGEEAYSLATRLLGPVRGKHWFRSEYGKKRLKEVESESLWGTLAEAVKR